MTHNDTTQSGVVYFRDLADKILEETLTQLPEDPIVKMALFIEVLRTLGYRSILQHHVREEYRLSYKEYQLLFGGWNLCVRYLYSSAAQPNTIPLLQNNEESQITAHQILSSFGTVSLLHRTAEMIRHKIAYIETIDSVVNVKFIDEVKLQLLDRLDIIKFYDLESDFSNHETSYFENWQRVTDKDISTYLNQPGNFLVKELFPVSPLQESEIDDLMRKLLFPWDSGRGIMIGYDAHPDVDAHFFLKGTKLAIDYREQAGLHSCLNIIGIDTYSITVAVATLISIHLKHVRFCQLASSVYPEISFYHSLTKWSFKIDFVKLICRFYDITEEAVMTVLRLLTLEPDNIDFFKENINPTTPLLIDSGSGFYLFPAFSLNENPFKFIINLIEHENPNVRQVINLNREEWQRQQLYAMFSGARYLTVDGNVKLRRGASVVTDIDAAIFDTLTGTLALFQIKWQDYNTNIVSELVSKSRNLKKSLDQWVDRICKWLSDNDYDSLCQSLRLSIPKKQGVTSVVIFGISHSMSRTNGFGFSLNDKPIAICNWSQFLRVRIEIGPADNVFKELYDRLRAEHENTREICPLQEEIQVGDERIVYDGLWCSILEENDHDST